MTESNKKTEAIVEQFARAVKSLDAALAQTPNEFIRDSAIQRFEFTFDLAWKAIKAVLIGRHGIACASPKSCLREAFGQNLIGDEKAWLELLEMRNQTDHTYSEATAERIFKQLPEALKLFQSLLEKAR